MHACRDFITKALAKCELEPNKSVVSTSSEQLSIKELELRFKLLRENRYVIGTLSCLFGFKVSLAHQVPSNMSNIRDLK
jgi:hypothetical protein